MRRISPLLFIEFMEGERVSLVERLPEWTLIFGLFPIRMIRGHANVKAAKIYTHVPKRRPEGGLRERDSHADPYDTTIQMAKTSTAL